MSLLRLMAFCFEALRCWAKNERSEALSCLTAMRDGLIVRLRWQAPRGQSSGPLLRFEALGKRHALKGAAQRYQSGETPDSSYRRSEIRQERTEVLRPRGRL